MKLEHEFYKLPLTFDIQRLQYEVSNFKDNDWHPHHEGFKGNFAIPLISVDGKENNSFSGSMKTTKALENSPYLLQVIAAFGDVFGRSRLMRLDPDCEVPLHFDINYHWYKRVRLHIPIVTDPKVIFHCGQRQVNMKEGESWIFNSWEKHKVVNNSNISRVHLVIDTTGSSKFWNMVNSSFIPWINSTTDISQHIDYNSEFKPKILPEKYNAPVVMTPDELENMIKELIEEISNNTENELKDISNLKNMLQPFIKDWYQLWSLYGLEQSGWDKYHYLRDSTFNRVKSTAERLKLTNGGDAVMMLFHCVICPALNPEVIKA